MPIQRPQRVYFGVLCIMLCVLCDDMNFFNLKQLLNAVPEIQNLLRAGNLQRQVF